MENLTGQFLVSTPHMPDPRFRDQVIFICAHNEDGAMGLAVNQPHPQMTLHEVFLAANLPLPTGAVPPVYLGGPVEPQAGFVLFQGEAPGRYVMPVRPDISVTRDSRMLEDIARGRGPEHYIFLLGYAGWGPGQLENELLDNGWLVVPASAEIIFHTRDSRKWQHAARAFGIDITQLGNIVGNA